MGMGDPIPIAPFLEWADHQFEHDGLAREGYDFMPLQMFKRQCFFNAWYDPIAPFTDYIGAVEAVFL